MLKGIPNIITPELLKILMEMGHGDELVIGDGNLPGQSMGKRCVRCDGHRVPELLSAILKLFPLDTYDKPVFIMEKVPGDDVETPIWDTFDEIVKQHANEKIEKLERFEFYERAKKAYAIVMTGETSLYGCMIIKKGILTEDY